MHPSERLYSLVYYTVRTVLLLYFCMGRLRKFVHVQIAFYSLSLAFNDFFIFWDSGGEEIKLSEDLDQYHRLFYTIICRLFKYRSMHTGMLLCIKAFTVYQKFFEICKKDASQIKNIVWNWKEGSGFIGMWVTSAV